LYKEYKGVDVYDKIRQNYHLLSYCGIIFIAILSIIVAENKVESLFTLSRYIIFFFSFFIILFLSIIINKTYLNFFLALSMAAILIESLFINLMIFDYVIINGNFLERSNDFRGFAGNINISSFSILSKCIIPIYILYTSKNKYLNIIAAIFISSSFLSIFLLMSRGSILAAVLIFIIIGLNLVLSNKKKNYIRSIYLTICLCFSFLSYNLINDKNITNLISERFATVANPQSDDSVNERVNFSLAAISSIKDNPILGIGIGNWKIKSIELNKDIIQNYRIPYFVHNDFLQLAAEIGILGGLLYLFFVFYPVIFILKGLINSFKFDLNFFILLIFTVFIVDSLINFPIDRAINFIYFIFTIAAFYNFNKIFMLNEK
jgi:O-antigen ligase